MLTLAVLMLVVYLFVRALHTIVTSFERDPTNRPMWVAAACLVVCVLGAVVTRGYPALVALSVASFLGLWVVARILEVEAGSVAEGEWSLMGDVLDPGSWWAAAA